MECAQIVQTPGCLRRADGTVQDVIIHTEYASNAGGGVIPYRTLYTLADSTPIALAAGDVVTPGLCPVHQRLTPELLNLGGPGVPVAHRPDGSTYTAPAGVQSVTVIALVSGLNDALDRVDVTTVAGTRTLRSSGTAITWAVDGDGDRDLSGGPITVTCIGLAMAEIIVTR